MSIVTKEMLDAAILIGRSQERERIIAELAKIRNDFQSMEQTPNFELLAGVFGSVSIYIESIINNKGNSFMQDFGAFIKGENK
jgi:hypothetical protein